MLRILKLAAAWLLTCVTLTGCWDIKHIQDINYLTSMGFDYEDGQYVVYVQLIDFTSVAKLESGKQSTPVPVWVGFAKGDTILSAIGELYRTSQMRIFYGEINTMVFSERILRKGLREVDELADRFHEMRYTPWIFGTRDPIDKLFAVTPLFNLSPLMSLMHQPQETFEQQSLLMPITLRELEANWNEPARSTLLPSIAITKEHWKSDNKPHAMLYMDGIYLLQQKKYKGYLTAEKAIGLRWTESRTNRSPIAIYADGSPQVGVYLEHPKIKITPSIEDGKAVFTFNVRLTGNISEVDVHLPEDRLNRDLALKVERQIRNTFEEGLKLKTDILQLEHALYRQKNREWKHMQERGGVKLNSASLREIHVSVKLVHSGKLKYYPH